MDAVRARSARIYAAASALIALHLLDTALLR
jgi:hypothetical protein